MVGSPVRLLTGTSTTSRATRGADTGWPPQGSGHSGQRGCGPGTPPNPLCFACFLVEHSEPHGQGVGTFRGTRNLPCSCQAPGTPASQPHSCPCCQPWHLISLTPTSTPSPELLLKRKPPPLSLGPTLAPIYTWSACLQPHTWSPIKHPGWALESQIWLR